MRTPDQIVSAEVHYCVSFLVSTLASGAGVTMGDRDTMRRGTVAALSDLCEQAMELCSPVLDYEEAATQAGWSYAPEFEPQHIYRDSNDGQTWAAADWESLCRDHDIEPYDREVFEHWIVSGWLADQLEAKGEKVDRDIGGMVIWARTTSGQGIASDSVIEAIAAELNAKYS